MMRTIASATLLLSLCACGQNAATDTAPPSVLVSFASPVQGELPATVSGFGSATPAGNGTQAINMAQPGQIVRLAVTIGASVRAGQLLATFATSPTARSTYQQAADAVVAAGKQRASTAQLLTQQLATRDQLAQADKALADARSALAALRAEGAGSAVQTLLAPFDGVVMAIPVAQGDRLQPGAPVMTVARSGAMVVTVGVDPTARPTLAVGQPVTLHRLDDGATIAGKVVRVDAALNPKTRLIDVDVSYPSDQLVVGQPAQADIEIGKRSGWIVPHAAVVTANGPAHVFQTIAGKAKAVPVSLVLTSGDKDLVTGPFDAKAPIIVDGAYQVNAGDHVRSNAQ